MSLPSELHSHKSASTEPMATSGKIQRTETIFCGSCSQPFLIPHASLPPSDIYRCPPCICNPLLPLRPSSEIAANIRRSRLDLFHSYATERQRCWSLEWQVLAAKQYQFAQTHALTKKGTSLRRQYQRRMWEWAGERAELWGEEFARGRLCQEEFLTGAAREGSSALEEMAELWERMEERCGLDKVRKRRTAERWAERGREEVHRLLRVRRE